MIYIKIFMVRSPKYKWVEITVVGISRTCLISDGRVDKVLVVPWSCGLYLAWTGLDLYMGATFPMSKPFHKLNNAWHVWLFHFASAPLSRRIKIVLSRFGTDMFVCLGRWPGDPPFLLKASGSMKTSMRIVQIHSFGHLKFEPQHHQMVGAWVDQGNQ